MSEKTDRLLEVGKELILTKGYNATPIDEICEQAGVTKGTFFYYFKTKREFAEALLAYIWAPIMEEVSANSHREPMDRLLNFLRRMAYFITTNGRLMAILNTELGEVEPDFRDGLRKYFHFWVETLRTHIATIKPEEDPEPIIDFIIAVTEGTPFINAMRGKENVLNAMQHLEDHLKHILLD
ncbi:MAG: TetR/AcrR family transcriptional regulator [Chloroflexi bacterium]|nr:TetR/AcrR family transcriptional regulator [Chloroflexota bacterium]